MIITNGVIVTWEKPNRILKNHAIVVQDGRIVEIGLSDQVLNKYHGEDILDARGQYVMPGNICAHTHFYGAYSRGLAIPGSQPSNFKEILDKLWWPLDKSLSLEAVKYSALVCIIDAIKHGTTTLIDHHASQGNIENSLNKIYEAVDESGIRASLCYEVTDRDGLDKAKMGIEENKRFIDFVKKEKPLNGRISACFGLHASLTLSDNTLEACRAAAPEDIGFHIHIAEDAIDEYDSLAKSGLRVVDRLYKHQILGPKTIAVHAVHIDAKEIELLAGTETWVTHQPRSNMNNAVGISNVESMLRAGIKVGLGNDGFSNDMWQEWKTAYLVHKLWNRDPQRMNGIDIIEMAIYNNSALVTKQFNVGQIGILEEGAQADIIFVNYQPFTPLTEGNLPWHILFGFNPSMVTTTIVSGKPLMIDNNILTLNENEVYSKAMELSLPVWQEYSKQF